jgi:hypothetical protein
VSYCRRPRLTCDFTSQPLSTRPRLSRRGVREMCTAPGVPTAACAVCPLHVGQAIVAAGGVGDAALDSGEGLRRSPVDNRVQRPAAPRSTDNPLFGPREPLGVTLLSSRCPGGGLVVLRGCSRRALCRALQAGHYSQISSSVGIGSNPRCRPRPRSSASIRRRHGVDDHAQGVGARPHEAVAQGPVWGRVGAGLGLSCRGVQAPRAPPTRPPARARVRRACAETVLVPQEAAAASRRSSVASAPSRLAGREVCATRTRRASRPAR